MTASERSGEWFRRIVIAHALTVASTRPPDILELGSGSGAFASTALAEAGFASIGVDESSSVLDSARAGAERMNGGVRPLYLAMDPERLEFGDDVFDLVCGTGLAVEQLAEVARVLRPDGAAVFADPRGMRREEITAATRHFGRVEARFFRRDLLSLLRGRARAVVLRLSEPRG